MIRKKYYTEREQERGIAEMVSQGYSVYRKDTLFDGPLGVEVYFVWFTKDSEFENV